MSDIEKEREKKENLLMFEIVESGYDTVAFQVYCEQQKQNGGSDLDVWTYEELAKTIKDFKQKEDQQAERLQRQVAAEQQMEQQPPQQFVLQKNIDDVNYVTEVECQLPQRNPLTDFILENSHKVFYKPQFFFKTKSDSIFSQGFGTFKVETKPIGWTVWRRFSDFQKLREILCKSFPQHLIPPIPGKKIKVKSTEQLFLEKRMKVLELFLQNCLYHPLFKTHPAFADFLSITDDPKLKEKYAVYEKQKGPSKPSEYVMDNGACSLEITPEINQYGQQLTNYLKNSQDVYKKLGLNFKKLFLDLDTLQQTLSLIQDNFKTVEKITENFSAATPNKTKGEIKSIQLIYQEMQKFMNGWYSGIIFQMNFVKDSFYEFFRYHRKMQREALDYLNNRNKMQAQYLDQKGKLHDKKDKLYLQPDTSKWELPPDIPKTIKELQVNKGEAFKYMLPKETQQLADFRDTFAFMNHQLVDEINQMLDFRIRVYAKKFLRVAQLRALEIARLHHVIANFLQQINELQGSSSGALQSRKASMFIGTKYDQFFGMKQV